MADAVIDNPILNSPFDEPQRHFRFGEDGITSDVVDQRRPSAYFMPIPQARRRAQAQIDTEWRADRIEENRRINQIRRSVGSWRAGGWPGATPTTRRLLEHWTDPSRERRLFFCQVEAVETAIYLVEAASRHGDEWIANELRAISGDRNPGLYRVAFKLATGAGKTVVMGMLIAWQALNKAASPNDRRFADTFLVVTPGITIKDRLRVLLPGDPDNYYRGLDLVPPADRERLGAARIAITNFHAFQPRETVVAARTTKALLARGRDSPFRETPQQVAARILRDLGAKREIVVLNDEAHHCYRRRPAEEAEESPKLAGDERKEAEQREEQARIWISGLEALQAKTGIKTLYDLSATPFFLRGSGEREGTLFPWVVSDFSLIDAIESGIVKVPRVPVSDDSGTTATPTYRDIWSRVRDGLPRKGRGKAKLGEEPRLPQVLEGALHSLYGNYERSFEAWREGEVERPTGATPPVFIVVCNNTGVSKLVFDYIAGWEKPLDDGTTRIVPGKLDLFSNVDGDRFLDRPNTILVDSEQLESGEAMSREFKQVAQREIEEFKAEYRARYPGRDADALTDEDLLREVMNTVGKRGKLGEGVRCVVSVSMLTEGWDANTVTHILGVRAFGTQLLCEQVVGRGLRRRSYAVNEEGRFDPEYAEVYGVPFSFIPAAGTGEPPRTERSVRRVRALPDREGSAIEFPRVIGYRHELSTRRLRVNLDGDSKMELSTSEVPSTTEVAGIVGAADVHTLDDLRAVREQQVSFFLAKRLLDGWFADEPWLFPQLVDIARRWMDESLVLKDGTFPGLLMLHQQADEAAARIYEGIVGADPGERAIVAVLAPYDSIGSTRHVDFDTSKPVMASDPERCHVSHVVADSGWEHKLADTLERMPEVVSYVKNQGLGFAIPYTIDGVQRDYVPDFIVRIDDGHADPLNLVLEVSGTERRDKTEKVHTARSLWVPGVNALGSHGRWAFFECKDPWNAAGPIRSDLGLSQAAATAV